MNLLELITKNDPNVQIQVWDAASRQWTLHEKPQSLITKFLRRRIALQGWKPHLERQIFRGLALRSGMRVIVRNAAGYWPEYARGDGVFMAKSLGNVKAQLVIGWSQGNHDELKGAVTYSAGGRLKNISAPPAVENHNDLVINVPLQKGAKLFFGIHRLLDRKMLYRRCTGTGVEVGPGPKPQILPGKGTTVKYVEQATPEEWHNLYGKETKVPVDPGLWKHYVVGNADNIPAARESLDFIFSSHVIEHLANPAGHLAYWASLLKPGGVIAAVIPDRSGCKDYVFPPSSVDEIIAEYRDGNMNPTLAHYTRWAKLRAPDADPAEILQRGRSIHVHFYTPESMQAILDRLHREIGFKKFSVISEHNHKDFFVIMEK